MTGRGACHAWRDVAIRLAPAAALGLAPPMLLAWADVPAGIVFGGVLAGLAGFAARLRAAGRRARGHDAALAAALAAAADRHAALERQLETAAAAEDARQRAAMNRMAETIEHTLLASVAPLSEGTRKMREVSDAIAAGAERLGQNAVLSSEAADRSVDHARQLAGTTERMNGAIQNISEQVAQATGITRDAVAAGGDARGVIATLTEQASAIESVIDLIRAIAAQTNLLALNATIEAARAGAAGKGFAVVAGEVKALAQKTARSTESIGQTIGAIRGSQGRAVAAVDRIVAAVGAMDRIATSIAAAVDEQREASAGIADSVGSTVTAASALSEQIGCITNDVGNCFEFAAEVYTAANGVSATTDAMLESFRSLVARAVRTSAEEVNRRAGARYDVDVGCTVTLADGPAIAGRLLDISRDGARLMLPGEASIAAGTPGVLAVAAARVPAAAAPTPFVTLDATPRVGACELRLRFAGGVDWAETLAQAA